MAKPDTRIQPVLLQPVAAPVDTFVRAAKPEESPLWQVAQSLKGLNANLDGFMAQRQEEASAADKLAGEQAFYKNNQTGYDEGVKQGLIPAYASKNFVELRIPIHSGRVFRFEAGHRSDLMSATIPI